MLNHRSLRKTLLSLCQYLLASLNRKLGMAFVVIVWYTNKECVPLLAASGKWSEVLWCGWNLLTLICCITLCQTKTCIVSCVQFIAIISGALGSMLPEQATMQSHWLSSLTHPAEPWACKPCPPWSWDRITCTVQRDLHSAWKAWTRPKKSKILEELFVGIHSQLSFSLLHVEDFSYILL